MRHLDKDGILIFSNNNRKFVLDNYIYQDYDVKDITEESIGLDFERNSKIHQCYLIRERQVVKVRKNPKKVVKKNNITL
jgi:23S rRNA (guanine2445-N2)-methyltransferase / 23S rRNA (guanine2069-N7)-methyltransferase